MHTNTIKVSESDTPTLKIVSADTRSALKDEGVSVCGKRRFLDLFAKGLGYKSFSEIAVVRQYTKSDGVDFVLDLADAAPTIGAQIVAHTEGLAKKDSKCIERIVRKACGLDRELVHHLGMQLSDRYYFSEDYGFFYSRVPIEESAGRLQGIWPVMHIWLKAEGVPGYMCEFTRSVESFEIGDFLGWGWSGECKANLFGVPDRLIVDQRLGETIKGFKKWCDSKGVELVFVGDGDRGHKKIRVACLEETKHEKTAALRMPKLEDASLAMYLGLADYFFSEHSDSPRELARLELLEGRDTKYVDVLNGRDGEELYIDTDGDESDLDLLLKYLRTGRKKTLIRDDIVFQSGIGGGQALGARYLAKKLGGALDRWSSGRPSNELEFVDQIRLSWPGKIDELEAQYSPMIGAGLDKSDLWLFDAWYFGVIFFDEEGVWLELKNDRVFFPELASNVGRLCGYAIPRGEDGYLLDIGNDTKEAKYAWMAMFPSDRWRGKALYFRVPRRDLDEWRKRWMLPNYLSWATHDFDTAGCLRRLSAGVTEEEQYGCGCRQWDELEAINQPLSELHQDFEAYFLMEAEQEVDELLSEKERVIAAVTEQTRMLFDWITWPMAKDEVRDFVCRLWGLVDFETLLASMRVTNMAENWGFNRIQHKEPTKTQREKMVEILMDASDEYVRDHAGVCGISKEGADVLLGVMLGEREGKWVIERTERGDWVCRTPNRLRIVDNLIDNWRRFGDMTEKREELKDLVEAYQDAPGPLAEAALVEHECGNTTLAAGLSLRAFELCKKAMPKECDLFEARVSYRYTANWTFLDVLSCRASLLEATGYHEEALDLFASIVSMNDLDAPDQYSSLERSDTPIVMFARDKVAEAEKRADQIRGYFALQRQKQEKGHQKEMRRAKEEIETNPTRH